MVELKETKKEQIQSTFLFSLYLPKTSAYIYKDKISLLSQPKKKNCPLKTTLDPYHVDTVIEELPLTNLNN